MHTTHKINQEIDTIVHSLVTSLADLNPINTVIINVDDKSSLFSKLVIISGSSQKHVENICDHLHKNIIDLGLSAPKVEGGENSEWVIFDLKEIIFHIMIPEVRAHYKLEEIWGGGDSVNILRDKDLKSSFKNYKTKSPKNQYNSNQSKFSKNLFNLTSESINLSLLFLKFWTYILIPTIIFGLVYVSANEMNSKENIYFNLFIIIISLLAIGYGLHKLNNIAWYVDWILLLSIAGLFNKVLIGGALGAILILLLCAVKLNSKQHFSKNH